MWEEPFPLWTVASLGTVGLINIRKLDEHEPGSEAKGKLAGSVALWFLSLLSLVMDCDLE